MQRPERSKLFHTIVVVGFSLASTACGSSGLLSTADRDGTAPSPDGSAEREPHDATPEGAASFTSSEAGSPVSDGATRDVGAGSAADAEASDGPASPDACAPRCSDPHCCPWPCYV